MTKFNDVFRTVHDPTRERRPLASLRDNDRVPDLQKYTVGELREMLRNSAPPPADITPQQVRYGAFPPRTVGNKALRWDPAAVSLPTKAQVGDVCLYVPYSGIEWMMHCSADTGTHMRWHVVGGPPVTVQNLGFSTVLTTAATFVTGMSYTTPYAGFWTMHIGGLVTMPAAASSNGYVEVMAYRNSGALNPASAFAYVYSNAGDETSVALRTPGTAGGNFQVFARKTGSDPRNLQRPWMILHCEYLDVPKT